MPPAVPRLTRTTLQVPVRGSAAHWDYGTGVVPVPGTGEVLLTPPSAASRSPWLRLGVATGELHVGSGMPGPMRDVLVPRSGPDRRWWVLGTYGVGRVDPTGPSSVHDVVRTGIGRYPNRLLDLGEHVGVATDLSPMLVLLPVAGGDPVGRLRMPRPGPAVDLGDGVVRVLAVRTGTAYDVDTGRRKVVRKHDIPVGKGPRIVGGVAHYLAGDPVALVTLDPRTLEVRTAGPPPQPEPVEVLGAGADGSLVVSSMTGFALVDPATGASLAEHVEPRGLAGAGMVTGTSTVVLPTREDPVGTVALVSW